MSHFLKANRDLTLFLRSKIVRAISYQQQGSSIKSEWRIVKSGMLIRVASEVG